MSFRQHLRGLEAAYEQSLSDKAEAIAREGDIQSQNDRLWAMLELCMEAMTFKASLHPSGAFTIETGAFQKIKGTREEAAALLATLTEENNVDTSSVTC